MRETPKSLGRSKLCESDRVPRLGRLCSRWQRRSSSVLTLPTRKDTMQPMDSAHFVPMRTWHFASCVSYAVPRTGFGRAASCASPAVGRGAARSAMSRAPGPMRTQERKVTVRVVWLVARPRSRMMLASLSRDGPNLGGGCRLRRLLMIRPEPVLPPLQARRRRPAEIIPQLRKNRIRVRNSLQEPGPRALYHSIMVRPDESRTGRDRSRFKLH